MKIETPQILWHNGSEGNGQPAPLYSVSILPKSSNHSSPNANYKDKDLEEDQEILATAGNNNEIHIWKIKLSAAHVTSSCQEPPSKKPKIFSVASPNIQHITTLTRHERSINSVQFSPNGNHIASAGDGGTLIVHTVPHSHSSSKKNRLFWNTLLQSEKDLSIKVVHTGTEDVMDISWSKSSDKFIIGTLDHSVIVFQQDFCQQEQIIKKWNCIWKNAKEHTHYVQGVAYDPLGVYLASQGSDRSVRVWQRKGKGMNSSCKKKVLMDQDNNKSKTDENKTGETETRTATAYASGALVESVESHLSSKFDVHKAKVLKYRVTNTQEADQMKDNCITSAVKKHHLFADESTVESFFRRLSWTTDGAFLVTPASLWHNMTEESTPAPASATDGPSFATYLFARHQFDKPYKVLHGLEKPSLVIRSNPILFQLPNQVQNDSKENIQSSPSCVASNEARRNDSNLPYRSIFAILTVDSILIYDTVHSSPLCIAKNLHYAGLTDCSWSSDGHHLVVSSTDGYISMISFEDGELGDIYVDAFNANGVDTVDAGNELVSKAANTPVKTMKTIVTKEHVSIPPCEPGESAIIAPPAKKARIMDSGVNVNTLPVRKKKRVPLLTSTESLKIDQSCCETGTVEKDGVEQGVMNLSIHNPSLGQSIL